VTVPNGLCVLGDGQPLLPVPAFEIANIQRIVAAVVAMESCDVVRVGRRVSFDGGPLRCVRGIIDRAETEHRLIVSASLLPHSVVSKSIGHGVSPRSDAPSSIGRPLRLNA
jgi:hypothetical protein